MTATKRKFDESLLNHMRRMPVVVALDRLGLPWKADAAFTPVKAAESVRLHVSVGAHVHELICTGHRWWDCRACVGGGGAIDLARHLLAIDFVSAVKRLNRP